MIQVTESDHARLVAIEAAARRYVETSDKYDPRDASREADRWHALKDLRAAVGDYSPAPSFADHCERVST